MLTWLKRILGKKEDTGPLLCIKDPPDDFAERMKALDKKLAEKGQKIDADTEVYMG